MNVTTKRTVAVGALVTGLALGGTGIAMAANGTAPSGSEATTTEDQQQEPSYTGSVTAPQDTESADGTETKDDEAAEAKALESLATVSPQDATSAALAAVPGTAGAVELDNENGYVVYSVEVTGDDGTTIEVKVDAGNATVLAQEADNDQETNDD
ncbi:PepSY domain-containing protein [Georgenia muralis]|uniref:Peptidase YpeB-like protein n=1 Tax=Georgenia muralis TaxID=154117 RepID=A0A3N4Z6S2_9MICO|nr:PepSY domain-containing protein [Georgenia muralis]RPF28027.1 peptidase YpeB-like protein [Georgenia muralis]